MRQLRSLKVETDQNRESPSSTTIKGRSRERRAPANAVVALELLCSRRSCARPCVLSCCRCTTEAAVSRVAELRFR